MKQLVIGINIILVILIGISLFIKPEKSQVLTTNVSKSINTDIFIAVEKKKTEEKKKVEAEIQKKEEEKQEQEKKIEESITQVENTISESVPEVSVESNVLEKQIGPMSAYGPDCVGCSGYLAAGFNARASIIYQDPTYGALRIVAGDPKYPYGTVVRISGTRLGTFNAIVLDRGGAIGIGRRFMFDLLCHSEGEASSVGNFYNVTFEILRYGY